MSSAQTFKAIYFPDHKEVNSKAKGYILAFGEKNLDLHKKLSNLGSNDLRTLLETNSYIELEQRAREEGLSINTYCLWFLRKKLENTKNADDVDTVVTSKIKPLEYFENKVLEGDCLDLMHQIPSKSINMILCDLPYGTTQNQWDSTLPLDKIWGHYERIIADNGVIALTGQGPFTAKLILSNTKLFKYKIVWIKSKPTNFLNAKKQPLRKHEDVCIFYKQQPPYTPQMTPGKPFNKGFRKNQLTGSYGDFKTVEVKSDGERYPTDVVYFKTAESEGDVFHPTQKPVELGRYLIRTYTKDNDIVLDNTCGSGSFLVSAVLEGRRFIGIEKNEEVYLFKKQKVDYIDVAKRRIKEANKQIELEKMSLKLF